MILRGSCIRCTNSINFRYYSKPATGSCFSRDCDQLQIKYLHKSCQLQNGLFVLKENYVIKKIQSFSFSLSLFFFSPQLQYINNEAECYSECNRPKRTSSSNIKAVKGLNYPQRSAFPLQQNPMSFLYLYHSMIAELQDNTWHSHELSEDLSPQQSSFVLQLQCTH